MDIIPVLSHEIRSPLTTIRAYADVLMHSNKALTDEERKEYASAIKRAVDQANRLIGNVLDVSLSEAGCLSLTLETFSLRELIWKTVRETKNEAKKRVIDVNLPLDLPDIEGDEMKLERVLKNLLANAVKFSSGDGTIQVSARSVYDVGLRTQTLVVSVRDNGIGIPREEQERIFTKFYRKSGSASYAPGLGIGLFVCKQIVEAHGGRIWVKSQPQKGSEFSFSLPVGRTDSMVVN